MHSVQHFVGIDIAAETFTAAIFIAPAQPLQSAPAFSNNATGFERFHDWLRQAGVTPSHSVLCLEATGVYGEALCYWFAAKDYAVAVEPPNKVKRAFPLKGHKTDAVDSRQIAEYAYRYFDELRHASNSSNKSASCWRLVNSSSNKKPLIAMRSKPWNERSFKRRWPTRPIKPRSRIYKNRSTAWKKKFNS